MSADEWTLLRNEIGGVFTPAASIQTRDFFAGRLEQLRLIDQTIRERGRHAIVYGERGVGKTSMVNILPAVFPDRVVVRSAANSSDNFATLWRNIFRKLTITQRRQGAGFTGEVAKIIKNFAETVPHDEIDADRVITTVAALGKDLVVVIDEFERLALDEPKRLTADVIKGLSDIGSNATVVIVGVAHDVNDLVGEHPSVERNMRQIHMPRMAKTELDDILKRGLKALNMTMDGGVRTRIIGLSQGFPHYTHLLGKYSAIEAIEIQSSHIGPDDFEVAVEAAIEDTYETIRNAYQRATMTTTAETIFPAVLLAAALASEDEHGTFRATDLVDPLSALLKKPYVVGNFNYNLGKLSSAERGNVLEKVGDRRPRYRFANPLMKPFVLLKAFSNGEISEEMLAPAESGSRDHLGSDDAHTIV